MSTQTSSGNDIRMWVPTRACVLHKVMHWLISLAQPATVVTEQLKLSVLCFGHACATLSICHTELSIGSSIRFSIRSCSPSADCIWLHARLLSSGGAACHFLYCLIAGLRWLGSAAHIRLWSVLQRCKYLSTLGILRTASSVGCS